MRYRTVLKGLCGLLGVVLAPVFVIVLLYAAYRPTGRPTLERDSDWQPQVSVVVPTYNEVELVTDRLEALLQTSYPAEQLEILIVDDSTDETADTARAFASNNTTDTTIRVVERGERTGVAAALNDGVAAATGEVVFRTDADARLGDETISEAVAVLADPAVGGVTGRQTGVVGDSAVESDYRNLLARLQALETRIDSVFIAHGPCFAFEREAFEPLPPDTVADDTAVAVGIRRGGKRVVMDPGLEFTEGATSDIRQRRERKDRRAVGLLQQLVRHRSLLGRQGGYGRLVLPLNWGLMIVVPWVLAVAAGVATLGGVAVAGPVGLLLPVGVGTFLLLGSREALGPLQPLHAVADAYLSLLIAGGRVVRGDTTAAWDTETGREGFD